MLFNNIENYQHNIPNIEIHNGENSSKSSENKINYWFQPNEINDLLSIVMSLKENKWNNKK